MVFEDELQEEPDSMTPPISLLLSLRVPRSTQGLAPSPAVPAHSSLVSHTLNSSPMPSPSQDTQASASAITLLLVSKPSPVPALRFSHIVSSLFPWHLGYWGEGFGGWSQDLAPERALPVTVPVLLPCLVLGHLQPLVGHCTTALQEGDSPGRTSFWLLIQLVPDLSCQLGQCSSVEVKMIS